MPPSLIDYVETIIIPEISNIAEEDPGEPGLTAT
jgi:hypothetical protein